jgi:hypothetical protein
MQPSTITGRPWVGDISLHETIGNKSEYRFSDHTDVLRDKVDLLRTDPKRAGNSYGVRRSLIRVTKDIEVDTIDGAGEVSPLRIGISTDIPVGTTKTQLAEAFGKALCVAFTSCDEAHPGAIGSDYTVALDAIHALAEQFDTLVIGSLSFSGSLA